MSSQQSGSADQIQLQLLELSAEVHGLRDNAARAARPFILLTVLLVAALVGLFFYLVGMQWTSSTTGQQPTQSQQLPPAFAEAIGPALTEKLNYLDLRQTALLDEARNSIERQSSVFTTVAAFFGLFTVFFGYRQLLLDSRGTDARDRHDQEMRNLVRSFQQNITSISSLITTLEKTVAYREQIQNELGAIETRAKLLETHQAESESALNAALRELNRDAVSVTPLGVDRNALALEENRRKLSTFAAAMDVAQQTSNVEGRLNPFCFYAKGLYHVATYQYEAAIDVLDTAIKRTQEEIVHPTKGAYPVEVLERLGEMLENTLVSCVHFQGICHKNLSQYGPSASKFRKALSRNKEQYDSLTYLLQVMFLDSSLPIREVEIAFTEAAGELDQKLQRATDDEERRALRRAIGTLSLNRGDVYSRKQLSPESRAAYRKYEDPEKAVQYYWRAHELLASDLATFSLAQALEHVGSSHWRSSTPTELYAEVYRRLKTRVAADHDKLYSVTLYYMLAACASKLADSTAVVEIFLAQARHCLRDVPTQISCFSPVSRVRLSRPEILDEMMKFEQTQVGLSYAATN